MLRNDAKPVLHDDNKHRQLLNDDSETSLVLGIAQAQAGDTSDMVSLDDEIKALDDGELSLDSDNDTEADDRKDILKFLHRRISKRQRIHKKRLAYDAGYRSYYRALTNKPVRRPESHQAHKLGLQEATRRAIFMDLWKRPEIIVGDWAGFLFLLDGYHQNTYWSDRDDKDEESYSNLEVLRTKTQEFDQAFITELIDTAKNDPQFKRLLDSYLSWSIAYFKQFTGQSQIVFQESQLYKDLLKGDWDKAKHDLHKYRGWWI